jgi:pimeloyl-ACP methyl ester carboxylesterase
MNSAVPQAKRNWPEARLDEYRRCTLDFFCNRKAHPIENLAKIKAPIRAIHCGKDIAYPVEYAEEFLNALHKAGVKADMIVEADASHFGSVTHAKSCVFLFRL